MNTSDITIIVHSQKLRLTQLSWYWTLPWKVKNVKNVYDMRTHNSMEFRTKIGALAKASGSMNINFVLTDIDAVKIVTDIFGNPGLWDDKMPSFDHLSGCYAENKRYRFLCVPSMGRMFSRATKMLCVQYYKKLYTPEVFGPQPKFNHMHLGDSLTAGPMLDRELQESTLLFASVDLETTRTVQYRDASGELKHSYGGVIEMVGVTFVHCEGNKYWMNSYTWDFTEQWHWDITKQVCEHDVPKTLQNGQYDIKYLWRWRIQLVNYLWDTQYGFQSATHDLPHKAYALNRVHAFYCRYSCYWKDGLKTTGRLEFQTYCARDCHNTAEATIAQMAAVSKETFINFITRFKYMGACCFASMRGMQCDPYEVAALESKLQSEIEPAQAWIVDVLGAKHSANVKIKETLDALNSAAMNMGIEDVQPLTATDSKNLMQFGAAHPMYDMLADKLSMARRNWISTFLRNSKDGKLKFCEPAIFNGGNHVSASDRMVFLYDLNPFGTKSGRLSSNSSSFWFGFNGQNAPPIVRTIMRPPKGTVFASSDAPQSESRTTAYLSRCPALIEAVESDLDFHSVNASKFFGVPYEEVTKEIRDTGKRVNHGANYNMQAWTLLNTMGIKAVRRAKELLKLPADWSLHKVCVYLMLSFDSGYPEIRGPWYTLLCLKVLNQGRLRVPTGYSPLLLSDPASDKRSLNSMVSTEPQSWSAAISMDMMCNLIQAEIDKTIPGMRYHIQLHDENTISVPIGTPIADVDKLMQDAGANSFDCGFRLDNGKPAVMVIPVGDASIGNLWSDVKIDPKPRTAGMLVEDLLPEAQV